MKCLCLAAATVMIAPHFTALGATVLYDNTNPSANTFDTVLYSVGPYTALGDQIQTISSGLGDQAAVELFNNGGAGTFDLELDLFDVGSPVGAELGSFDLTGISTTGGDVLDLTFALGGLALPQNLIFALRPLNQNPADPTDPLDLGVDMFEPPDVGSSDNTFMIAESTSLMYEALGTNSENVYFQLTGTPTAGVPEPSFTGLMGLSLLGVLAYRRRRT